MARQNSAVVAKKNTGIKIRTQGDPMYARDYEAELERTFESGELSEYEAFIYAVQRQEQVQPKVPQQAKGTRGGKARTKQHIY